MQHGRGAAASRATRGLRLVTAYALRPLWSAAQRPQFFFALVFCSGFSHYETIEMAEYTSIFRYLRAMKLKFIFPLLLAVATCAPKSGLADFNKEEKALINESDSLMHVFAVTDSSELAILRAQSKELTAKDLKSPEFQALVAKMKYTVQDPSQNGVGIASPQVGLNRRVIVVCRLDKPGEPFEAYANPVLDSLWGETIIGREGCLSIPRLRGNVPRSEFAIVRHINPETLKTERDTVSAYVARIFQHEIDHLNGILYTDLTEDLWSEEE
jgi:peptide deformylase